MKKFNYFSSCSDDFNSNNIFFCKSSWYNIHKLESWWFGSKPY